MVIWEQILGYMEKQNKKKKRKTSNREPTKDIGKHELIQI